MRRESLRKLLVAGACLVAAFETQAVFGITGCYTPWATRVVLNGNGGDQVGIATLNNKLVVTWGDWENLTLQSAVSSDGVNWTYSSTAGAHLPYVQTGQPTSGPVLTFGGGGVTMTASASCGRFYVAYPGYYGGVSADTLVLAYSTDGLNWTGTTLGPLWYDAPFSLSSPTQWSPNPPVGTIQATAAPALYGMNANVIGIAFPQLFDEAEQQEYNKGSPSYTYNYSVQMAQVDCNLQNFQMKGPYCTYPSGNDSGFFLSGTNCQSYVNGLGVWEWDEGFKDQAIAGPMSPLWTGAIYNGNVVELRALGTGNSLGNQNPPIWYNVNQGPITCVYTPYCDDPTHQQGEWTNNGIGGAVNPADGTVWLTKSCSYFNSDSCGGTPYFNIYHEAANGLSACSMDPTVNGSGEVAYGMPSMTFWNGKLWMAWREQGNQNTHLGGLIVVASINPANIGWNGAPSGGGGGTGTCCDGSITCTGGKVCNSNCQCSIPTQSPGL